MNKEQIEELIRELEEHTSPSAVLMMGVRGILSAAFAKHREEVIEECMMIGSNYKDRMLQAAKECEYSNEDESEDAEFFYSKHMGAYELLKELDTLKTQTP